MYEKLIKVFYGEDLLPYKDKARTVHYPLVGGTFLGASDTTKIRFYYIYVCSPSNTIVAESKRPNGTNGRRILTKGEDEDGLYAELSLSSWYLQYKGDLYISIKCFSGDVNPYFIDDQENDISEWTELGSPVIQATGAIKLSVNYTPIGPYANYQDEFDTYQDILAMLEEKPSRSDVALYIGNIEDETYPTYQALFDYVGLRPFIAFYEGDLCMFHFVEHDTEPTTYSIRQVSPYGVFETDILTMTDPVFPGYDHCLLDTVGCVEISGGEEGEVNPYEYERLTQKNAFVLYNDYFYRKVRDSRTLLVFENISVTGDVYNIEFTRERITINKATKRYQYGLNTYQTYSASQIDQWLDGKADLDYVNENFAKLGSQNTFTYSPQTNEVITDESADTKLSTKKYVKDVMNEHLGDYSILNGKVSAIESKIPSEASSSNKLADKDFVNSTINSLAAFYITKNAQGDPFATLAELQAATVFYSGGEIRVPTRNDYCLVNADETHDDAACRYIYQGTQWEFQFVVNETAFTADQLAAINSGITQVLVSQITTNQNAITSINAKLPRIKDFVIPINAWQLDSETGKYYAELDAGDDFVIVGNDMKNYTGTNKADTDLIMFYGIVASSNATTQKFRFDCLFVEDAPDQIINYTISMYGGN